MNEIKKFNIGYEPEYIVSLPDNKPDFRKFWDESLAELAKVAPEYKLTLIPDSSTNLRKLYKVSMKSFGGVEISGYYCTPVKRGKDLMKEEGIEPSLVDVNGQKRENVNLENIVRVDYKGDDGKLLAEVDKGIVVEYNVPGNRVFTNKDNNLIDTMIRLRNEILKGNTVEDKANSTTTVNGELGNLDKALDLVLKSRSEVGAKMKRMDEVDQRLRDNKLSITDLLSKTIDTDITETINDLKVQESVQRMSLSVGAKIIQPTLVDFLR
jgi:flagellin-like hook-associated protein FlgL